LKHAPQEGNINSHDFFIDCEGHKEDSKLKLAIKEAKKRRFACKNTWFLSSACMSKLLDNINKGIAELHPYEPGRSIDEVVAEYKPDKVC